MYSLKDEIEAMFLNDPDKVRAKKKLNDIFDRYGESRRDIENGTTDTEFFEYIMASAYEKEVLEERRKARIDNEQKNVMQQKEEQKPQKNVAENEPMEEEEEEKEEYSASEQVKKVTEDKELAEKQKKQTDADAEALKKMREQTEKEQKLSTEKQNKGENNLNTDIEKRMNLLLEKSKEHLKSKDAEDMVEHIYLDIYGNMTVGVGKVINDEKLFMSVNFLVDGRPATPAEKRKAYKDFQQMKKRGKYGSGYRADKYKNVSPLRVNQQTMEDLLDKHIRNDIKRLRSGMPEFESLPLPLQEVLVDLRYNSGALTEKGWSHLREAIREKNLTNILANINRKLPHEERLKWAQEKIRSIKNWGYWKN